MTRDEIRETVLRALTKVAPEIDPATLRPDREFRVEYELDSMDFLNVVIGLHDALGITVPERDYPKLATLNGAVEYLAGQLGV